MELKDLVNALEKATEPTQAYLLLKAIIDNATEKLEPLGEDIKSNFENGEWEDKELGKKLILLDSQKSSLDTAAILKNLSEDEIRHVFKPSEKNLTDLNRKDLLEKYKSITLVKQLRVTALKDA